jgi:integrase
LGTWGRITLTPFRGDDSGQWVAVPKDEQAIIGARYGRWRARCKVRDLDGRLRDVERWAETKTAAERALRSALRDRVAPGRSSGLSPESRLREAAATWLTELGGRDLARSTRSLYGYAVANYVLPLAGELALREIRPPNVDRVLSTVRSDNGPAAAKTTRAVLSGILGLAVRHGAMPVNPVRDAAKLSNVSSKESRRQPRALTRAEADQLLEKLAASELARTHDLADLVTFMLGTGCRIGEANALRWSRVDLSAGTVEIDSTVIRIKGEGLEIQEKTKTRAGWRVLALPPRAVTMLQRRRDDERLINKCDVVFPSPKGHLRDASNTSADLRKVLDGAGFPWATSHTFRKTVATRLDELGLSARQVADQLGHARPSLTQDVSMGRRVTTKEAVHLL